MQSCPGNTPGWEGCFPAMNCPEVGHGIAARTGDIEQNCFLKQSIFQPMSKVSAQEVGGFMSFSKSSLGSVNYCATATFVSCTFFPGNSDFRSHH